MMNKEEIDTFQTDTPVCPWCGATSVDLEGFLDETEGDDQCSECGRWYSWESESQIQFFTREIDWLEKWKKYNRCKIQQTQFTREYAQYRKEMNKYGQNKETIDRRYITYS